MKLIIDIPKKTYNEISEKTTIKCGEVFAQKLLKYIKNGTPIPDNATNGDVIKALFPNFYMDERSHTVWVGYDNMSFHKEWWNAKYMEGEDEDNTTHLR